MSANYGMTSLVVYLAANLPIVGEMDHLYLILYSVYLLCTVFSVSHMPLSPIISQDQSSESSLKIWMQIRYQLYHRGNSDRELPFALNPQIRSRSR